MEKYPNEEEYERACFALLENALKKNKKKIVLMIDNIGDMLAKFSEKESQRLREVLIQTSEIRIIGASSSILEFSYDYSKPFFEFFQMYYLDGLNKEDTIKLILKLSKIYNNAAVEQLIYEKPEKIGVLRRLIGGVIRTNILLFDVFFNSDGD